MQIIKSQDIECDQCVVGIPTYNRFRELCGLPVGSSFAQLPDFTQELKDSFANVYDNVNDIDLFSGGLAET